ncbi:MAG: transposase [Butyrivibrio sp.]|nr:transposase [Butyrivibrio sp.]
MLAEIAFPKGNDTVSAVTQKVKQDFSTALKNGLSKGERTITNYKRTNPLLTRGRDLKFYHEYKSYNDFLDKLFTNELEVFVRWVNKIRFKIFLGNPHKSHELRCVIQNIFEEIYKVQGSSIQFDSTEKKIILNLTLKIPKKKTELDGSTVVGVDLGVAIPAVCALNNDEYAKEFIGSKDDFLRVRTKIQAQKRRLQKSLKNTNGRRGRDKKLKPLKKFEEYEKNFVRTYSHMVSRRIVKFAVRHNAKYINVEDLEGYRENDFILRNWSYYELQQQIIYKAGLYGIEVRKINPYHTSQTCCRCGHWEEGQRTDRSHFKCKNCGIELNADFNAAKNIAKSEDFR